MRDDAGRIQQIKVTFNGSTTTLVSNVSYYPFGPPNTIVYNNGLTQTRTHDTQYRLSGLTLAGASTLEQLAYTLDPAGNVTDLQDQLNSTYSRDYAYDVLNRLTGDNGVSAGNPTYTYDANGNRLTRTATVAGFNAQTITYPGNSNRMSAFNGTSVTHDGLGNLTGGVDAASFSYGANTRLSQVAEYSNDLYLTYNGLGELARTLQTTEDGCGAVSEINREYYHFAPDGRALELVQENSQRVQWDWIWLDNLPVLQFEDSYDGAGTLIGTTATYLHPDHLGTPRIGTDTAGAIVWRYRSDGFGTPTNTNSRVVRLRLPGQIALGLGASNYNYFRDYDPQIGRYLESDPIGLDGGSNSYSYTGNMPLTAVDVNGLDYQGNVFPGYGDQNWLCDTPAGVFNNWRCTRQCCISHDLCYQQFKCNWTSWFSNERFRNPPCRVCNAIAAACVIETLGRDDCEGRPSCVQNPRKYEDPSNWLERARRRSSPRPRRP